MYNPWYQAKAKIEGEWHIYYAGHDYDRAKFIRDGYAGLPWVEDVRIISVTPRG